MSHAIFRRCAGVALLLAACTALAQPAASAERYSTVPASADGIGERYMGREISAVMGWQAAAWLEREERDREERTDLLLAALALQPGMVVADIGAGTGYQIKREAAVFALDWERTVSTLPWQHVVIFRKRG